MEFLWTGKIKMPVKFPFGDFEWSGVYGLQIKTIFIGVVIGDKILPAPAKPEDK